MTNHIISDFLTTTSRYLGTDLRLRNQPFRSDHGIIDLPVSRGMWVAPVDANPVATGVRPVPSMGAPLGLHPYPVDLK
ncbi:hypothetical protein [Burkholderia ubonensis]|uniref:hypothetical protein n=1 Tax=Burkholderia ubonensis TaxID=101571 RepID=UPI001177A98D|nr:hypothetical protein [Burkholderia ubonensis]